MRPRIGVTSWHHQDGDERWEFVKEPYTRAVAEAGGLPVILPIATHGLEMAQEYVDGLDGLIFTGGEDVHPSFYGEEVLERCGEIDEKRDLFERDLFQAARDRMKPVLGICRGLQLINVACGGSLYQDLSYRPGTLPDHQAGPERRYETVHSVRVRPGTRLAAIMGAEKVPVTSTHHQIVRKLAPGFRVSAESGDGVIEGIESDAHPFLLAVQWHPERLALKEAEQLALFRALVRAASPS